MLIAGGSDEILTAHAVEVRRSVQRESAGLALTDDLVTILGCHLPMVAHGEAFFLALTLGRHSAELRA